MIISYLFIIVVCCIGLFYTKWRPVKQYWARLGVAYLPPHPLVGSLTFLMRQNPGDWMRYVYEHYKGPYVGIWLFWRPALVINCPELARNVLVKDSANFRNRFMSSGDSDPLGFHSILLIKDPVWTNLRKHLTGAFTSSKLKYVHSIAMSKSKDIVQRIHKDIKHGSIDIRMLVTDYTTDVFGIAAFGVTSDATLTGEGPLRKITKDFMKFDLYRGLCWISIFFWPELVNVFRFTFTPKNANIYFRKIFRQILLQYEENKNIYSKCLIESMVQLKNTDIFDKNAAIDEVIASQAASFLIAAFDTTGSALTFVLYELAFHQKHQDRLYEEILKSKEKYGVDFINYENIQNITYLDWVIKEILRLRPPMAWLDRVALNDYKVDDNLTIKAGTPVYVNGNGMHYDPEYFPEPEKFDPERFSPENESKIKPYTYLPFGEGPRMCIGTRFAQSSMKCALSMILLNFKVEPTPGSPTSQNITVEKKALFYTPGQNTKLKLTPRGKSCGLEI